MPTRRRQFRRWLVILLLTLLAPVMPGKMNLCLLPGGEVHLEVDCDTPCSLAATQAQPEEEPGDSLCRLNPGEEGCLDFTVGENATSQQNRNLSQAATAGLIILPRPVGLFPTGQLRNRELPPAPSPHLKSQQITVLRI